jgi:hypothetical protein
MAEADDAYSKLCEKLRAADGDIDDIMHYLTKFAKQHAAPGDTMNWYAGTIPHLQSDNVLTSETATQLWVRVMALASAQPAQAPQQQAQAQQPPAPPPLQKPSDAPGPPPGVSQRPGSGPRPPPPMGRPPPPAAAVPLPANPLGVSTFSGDAAQARGAAVRAANGAKFVPYNKTGDAKAALQETSPMDEASKNGDVRAPPPSPASPPQHPARCCCHVTTPTCFLPRPSSISLCPPQLASWTIAQMSSDAVVKRTAEESLAKLRSRHQAWEAAQAAKAKAAAAATRSSDGGGSQCRQRPSLPQPQVS